MSGDAGGNSVHRPWRLGAVAGVRVSGVDKVVRAGELPVQLCNYMDVYRKDTIRPSTGLMSATATAREVEKYGLEPGDVVITKDSEDPTDIAVPAYVEESADDLVCGYHLAIIRPGPLVRGRYLKHWFDLPRTRAYFGSCANGATRFGLTIGAIERCRINLPELSEQDRVVEALSEWDRAIELAERRLDTARDRKRGLLLVLLTGDTRFPRFRERPWREVRLDEIVALRRDPPTVRATTPCVELEQIEAHSGRLLTVFESSDVSDKRCFHVGDILFGRLRPYLQKHHAPTFAGVCSSEIWVLRPRIDVVASGFAYAIVQSPAFLRAANRSCGSRMPRADWGVVSQLALMLPSLPEQRRIAAVLNAADTEIDLQRDLITHLRAQKRSLLEQLLAETLSNPATPDPVIS